ncbi:MAG: hypothetical protein AAGC60_20925 [Acidobacteriota bacterium]
MTLSLPRVRFAAISSLVALTLGLLVAGAQPANAAIESAEPLDALFTHYEAIRVTLVGDTTDGVAGDAREIATAARALTDRSENLPTGGKAGTPAELLPEIATAADAVATAEGLGAVRDAYYELSKLLVRLRGALAATTDDLPEVIYCSMIKKSWLQPPDTPIGNPYAGAVMPGCGELVS